MRVKHTIVVYEENAEYEITADPQDTADSVLQKIKEAFDPNTGWRLLGDLMDESDEVVHTVEPA